MLTDTDRKLAALTATLVSHGALPAFYRTPRKQRRHARKLQRAISPMLGDVASTLLGLLDAGAISPVNELQVNGALLADQDAVGQRLQGAYRDAYLEAAEDGFRRQAIQVLDRAGIQLSWDLVEPRALEVLEELSFRASEQLMQRVTGDVRGVLLRGVEEGLGTREIGDRLRDEIRDLSARQSEVIARTEVNSAANRGNYLAMEEAEVAFVQWIAAQDSRTRPEHLAHHALVVRRGERFPNGLLHPGDRDGTSIGSWISCRCAGSAYFPLRSELVRTTPFVGRA